MSSTSGSAPEEDEAELARVRSTYDAVAEQYDSHLSDELTHKAQDRALLRALVDLVASGGAGVIADVGCGSAHVTAHLARVHPEVVGLDPSPAMIAVARRRHPRLRLQVADMLRLPVADGSWSGITALYSIIHFVGAQRAAALAEFARVLRPGGWLLVAFHIDGPDHQPGQVKHLTRWFGHDVDLDGHFLDPQQVIRDLSGAGFTVTAQTLRQPDPTVEYPSRRAYLLAHTSPEPLPRHCDQHTA